MSRPILPHPVQPIVTDGTGTQRFRENRVVHYLVSNYGLNELARLYPPDDAAFREDWVQLSQLIGYSLGGFEELSHVRTSDIRRVRAQMTRQRKESAQ